MDDDFLKHYRKEPRRQFEEDLRKRLREKNTPSNRSASNFLSRPLVILAILIVLVLAFSIALPSPRSMLAQSVSSVIAGLYVIEEPTSVSELPFGNLHYNDVLRWSDLDKALPFKVRLPTGVPRGYKLLDVVPVLLPSEKTADLPFEAWTAYAIWMPSAQKHRIVLRMSYYQAREKGEVLVGLPDGSFSIKEVKVNGRPAALACVGNVDHSVGPDLNDATSCVGAVQLIWVDEGTKVVYALEAEAGAETILDLLQMAQSIR